MFTDDRRRKINLGGASTAQTHAAILDQAKARRLERESNKRKQENAIRIQAWWRGHLEARSTRRQLRACLEQDLVGIMGMRCLVLLGGDEESLALWSSAVSKEILFAHASGPDKSSWLVLIRQIAFHLLQSIAKSPQSPHSLAHISVLDTLMSPSTTASLLDGPHIRMQITQYLLDRNLHQHLSNSIQGIPIEQQSTSKFLPLIIPLITYPLATFPIGSRLYTMSLTSILTHILTIPLLPNRIPTSSLTHLSSRLPIASLNLVHDSIPQILSDTRFEEKYHLIATLSLLTPPRYPKLPKPALETYLVLLTSLINALPVNSLDPAETGDDDAATKSYIYDADPDSDEPKTHVTVVSSFDNNSAVPLSPPDARTFKRLRAIFLPSHLSSLISVTTSRHILAGFLLSLTCGCPKRKEEVLRTILVYGGGGLVRELYRGHVRGCALGKDGDMSSLTDPKQSSSWPPLLFLTDLYAQSLRTMGDDEFFGTSMSATAGNIPRNPLTLDELASFSRQLLNIAATLYWRAADEQQNVQHPTLAGTRYNWEGVRESLTKCLVEIHARDSRKPFLPKNHWLIASSLDVQSFVEAAVYEDQQLAETDTGASSYRSRLISAKQMAYLSPRLGILNNIPFSIPFTARVTIFRNFVANDMVSRGTDNPYEYRTRRGRTRAQIRRGHVAEDGFDRLSDVDLKAPIEITFIDQFGEEEAGIDGGGVFKEFFTSLCKEVFDTDRGLWLANKSNELYPNPHSYATEPHSLNWYRFIGRILGKALYQGILVDVAFAGFFLAKWLGKQSYLDDLASLDPDLYNGLIFLKHYTGNPEDLSLNFAMAIEEFGQTKTVDLIPNGSNITVTRENRLLYIHLVSHYRLSKQIKLQSEAFFEGLSEMIHPKWLRMFNQHEVQILLGGVNSPIDLDDLRAHTQYGGLYGVKHPTIVAFWNVLESFDQEQRMALLRFVTSCSRPPLLGFKELVPNFAIRDAGTNQARLPTSSTCVNLLKLPLYQSETVLREKLLKAITSGAGFDLS